MNALRADLTVDQRNYVTPFEIVNESAFIITLIKAIAVVIVAGRTNRQEKERDA